MEVRLDLQSNQHVADSVTPQGGTAQGENFTYDDFGDLGVLMDSSYAFVYGPDGTVEQVSLKDGTVDYLLTDSSGSVRGVVSGASGSLIRSTTYDPFGNPETATVNQGGVNYPGVTLNTPVGATGAYTDPTGLTFDGETPPEQGRREEGPPGC